MRYNELYRILKENGWTPLREGKKHTIYEREGRTVSVPRHPSKEVPKGTLLMILKQAGLKL